MEAKGENPVLLAGILKKKKRRKRKKETTPQAEINSKEKKEGRR